MPDCELLIGEAIIIKNLLPREFVSDGSMRLFDMSLMLEIYGEYFV